MAKYQILRLRSICTTYRAKRRSGNLYIGLRLSNRGLNIILFINVVNVLDFLLKKWQTTVHECSAFCSSRSCKIDTGWGLEFLYTDSHIFARQLRKAVEFLHLYANKLNNVSNRKRFWLQERIKKQRSSDCGIHIGRACKLSCNVHVAT